MPRFAARAVVMMGMSLVVGTGALGRQAASPTGEVLAQRSGCVMCHRAAEKGIGPSYKSIAQRYTGVKDAEKTVADHILKGTGPSGVGWMAKGEATVVLMPPSVNLAPEDSVKLARWILGVQPKPDETAASSPPPLTVRGAVEHQLALSNEELRAFRPVELDFTPVDCKQDAPHPSQRHLKGVLLKDLLNKAAITSKDPHDTSKIAVIASAADGSIAVFSWSELFNSPLGDGVVVVYEQDGKPLADDQGNIALVSTKDTCTGPRHIKSLQSIEVRKLAN